MIFIYDRYFLKGQEKKDYVQNQGKKYKARTNSSQISIQQRL